MIVSSIIEVRMPLIIANSIMYSVANEYEEYWKNNIVPKSPIEQPRRHQRVFTEAFFQVDLHLHEIEESIDKFTIFSKF